MAKYFPVQAGFGEPRKQSRWTVAFRLILAIPLLVWYFLLSIAAGFLILIGWFAALILGRLPYSFVRPLSNYIVFGTRMFSYTYLMNDAYPPFSASRDFSVNLAIPNSKISRWTVLFRFILVIPAAVVSTLVSVGAEIASVFIWLIVLVKGEMPVSLFGALAAVLRFQSRLYAYYMMITNKYPGELFGDTAASPGVAPTTPEESFSPGPPTTDLPVHFGVGEPTDHGPSETATSRLDDGIGDSYLVATPGAPVGPPVEFTASESSSGSDEPPRTARLVLSRGSKTILVVFLILGVLGYSADAALQARLVHNESALSSLTAANNTLVLEIASAKSVRSSCTSATDVCVQQYFTLVAADFSAFQVSLFNTTFPSNDHADVARLETATSKFVALLEQLKSESSVSQAQLNQLQTLGNAFDTDFNQVNSDLTSPI